MNWFKKRTPEPDPVLVVGPIDYCMCFACAARRAWTRALNADPDPTIIAQLIETGRAEVTHGG